MTPTQYVITGRPVGSPINPPEAILIPLEDGVGTTITLDLTTQVKDEFVEVGALLPAS